MQMSMNPPQGKGGEAQMQEMREKIIEEIILTKRTEHIEIESQWITGTGVLMKGGQDMNTGIILQHMKIGDMMTEHAET